MNAHGCPGPVACDLARDTFALEEAELRARLAAYRFLAQTAIHELARVTAQLDAARRQIHALRADLRRAA